MRKMQEPVPTRIGCIKYILLAAVLLQPAYSYSQEDQPVKRTIVKINPLQVLIAGEYAVAGEFYCGRNLSLEVSAGYSRSNLQPLIRRNAPVSFQRMLLGGDGPIAKVGLRKYMEDTGGLSYFSIHVLYKNLSFSNYTYSEMPAGMEYRESGKVAVLGAQLLAGKQVRFRHFILDHYIGIGIREKGLYASKVRRPPATGLFYVVPDMPAIIPSVHAGINIGFGF